MFPNRPLCNKNRDFQLQTKANLLLFTICSKLKHFSHTHGLYVDATHLYKFCNSCFNETKFCAVNIDNEISFNFHSEQKYKFESRVAIFLETKFVTAKTVEIL